MNTEFDSEHAPHTNLFIEHCYRPDGLPGCGIDLGSQGHPCVPWAWQLELPPAMFHKYSGGALPYPKHINLRGSAFDKFVEDESLDFIFASHLLEDVAFSDWAFTLRGWWFALKPGGKLIILCPERSRWAAKQAAGQIGNPAHRHEPELGDLPAAAEEAGFYTILERLTNAWDGDYSILYVGQKPPCTRTTLPAAPADTAHSPSPGSKPPTLTKS